MKPIIAFFLCLLFIRDSNSSIIRGIVTEKDTRQPIEGVTLKIHALHLEVRTDAQGIFRFGELVPDRYEIEVTHLKYKAAVLGNIVHNSGKETVLYIELEENTTQLSGINIKAKPKQGQPNNEMSSVSTRLFTVDETDRFAGSRGDPARMASNFAGVQGADDSKNDIIIRGNSPQGVLWRLEGIDIPNPNHFAIPGTTGGSVSIINNKILANSDFSTGAFPAEYGNSIAGVFDLKMRNGNNEKNEFSSQLGFLGWDFLAEGPFKKKRKASFLISGRYSTLALFDALKIPIGTDAVPRYSDGAFKFHFHLKKHTIDIFGIGGYSTINILISNQKKVTKNIYGDNDRDQYFTSMMGVIGTTWLYKINSSSFTKSVVSYSFSRVNVKHQLVYRHTENRNNEDIYILDSIKPNLGYRFDQGIISLHSFYQKKISKRTTIKTGIIASIYNLNFLDSNFNFDTTSNAYGKWYFRWNSKDNPALLQLYGQIKYIWSDRWVMNAGWHIQYFSRGNSISYIEPRLGLRYHAGKSRYFSFGSGIHSQIQSPYAYYYILPGNIRPHNYSMRMTRSAHLVFGYEQPVGKGKRLKAEVYYQYLWDIPVSIVPSSFSLVNTGAGFARFFPPALKNNGTAYNYGFELTYERFFYKGMYYLTTLSLFDAKYKGSDGVERNSDFNTQYAWNGLLAKEYKLGKKNTLCLGGKFTVAGARRYSPMDTTESIKQREYVEVDRLKNSLRFGNSYQRFDIRISFKRNSKKLTHEFALDLVNVTNRKNILKYSFVLDPPTYNKLDYQLGFLPLFYYKVDF